MICEAHMKVITTIVKSCALYNNPIRNFPSPDLGQAQLATYHNLSVGWFQALF